MLRTARLAQGNDWLERKILNEIMGLLIETDFDRTPAEITYECHRAAERVLGMNDPYREEKVEINQQMLALERELRDLVERREDRLLAAAKLAAAANGFDDLLSSDLDMEVVLRAAVSLDFSISDFDTFLEDFGEAREILYILDSCGEVVADKIFLEQFPEDKRVTLVVRGSPILLDVTREDLLAVGLEGYRVIDPGIGIPGIPLELASVEFREIFEEADLILAKGQGNYETLRTSQRECYYLFQVKCGYMANQLGVQLHNILFIKE